MCRPDYPSSSSARSSSAPPSSSSSPPSRPLRLLLSVKSYEGESKGQGPDAASSIFTALVFILFLVGVEQFCQKVLYEHRDMHELLEDDLNRRILARHIGVDTLSCVICVLLSLPRRSQYDGVWNMYFFRNNNNKKKNANQPPEEQQEGFVRAAYLNRVLVYDPECFRLCLFFAAYQMKNLYDTIIFNDGPEFIFHHIFSALVAYGGMAPKISNYYSFFFFGLSEVSTAILCVLANFDQVHGVKGLAEAFPTAKIVLAACFVVAFIVCRVLTWPVLSYHFWDDVYNTLKHHGDDPRVMKRKGWFLFQVVANAGLTLLQVAWLFQIFYLAHQEMVSMGIL